MRGIPQFNFPAFFAVADRLIAEGHEVFNPAARVNEKHGEDFATSNATGCETQAAKEHGFSLRDAMGVDTAWICKHADGIYMLAGWKNSKGATAELALAQCLTLKIMYEDAP